MANAINNSGQVVGLRSIGSGVNPYNAFVWSAGIFIDLGVMAGPNSSGTAVNGRGQVVGWFGSASYSTNARAFLWEDGQAHNLGPIPSGVQSAATAISDDMDVVGIGNVPFANPPPNSVPHAFWWTGSGMWDIGVPSGFDFSGAVAIGAGRQIVGTAGVLGSGGSLNRAFLWRAGAGVDLNALVSGQVILLGGTAINERGEILAFGRSGGYPVAVLLWPQLAIRTDLDHDGNVGLSDLALLLSAFGRSNSGDVDNDGTTGLSDLSLLLSQFGTLCW
jgi:probable HAF family extracellular repeat protein